MKKIIVFIVVVGAGFLGGALGAKFFFRPPKIDSLAEVRIERIKAMSKALREGKAEYEFNASSVPPLSR